MPQQVRATLTVPFETGLHARTAAALANAVRPYRASVTIRHGSAKADGRSVTELVTLCAECGTQIQITAVGNDATDALQAVRTFFAEAACQTCPPTQAKRNGLHRCN